jgi:hypothetical protein
MSADRASTAGPSALTRRHFLGAGLAVAALLQAGRLRAAPLRTVAGIALGTSPASDAFFAALPAHCERWERDLTQVMQTLLSADAAQLPDVLVGFSRTAELGLIAQVARERGYTQTFLARHRLSPQGIEHEASGHQAALVAALPDIAARGESWAAALARAVGDGAADRPSVRPVGRRSATAGLASRPDHVVSWVFARAEGVHA